MPAWLSNGLCARMLSDRLYKAVLKLMPSIDSYTPSHLIRSSSLFHVLTLSHAHTYMCTYMHALPSSIKVDGMPTYEMFIDSADLGASGGKPLDSNPHTFAQRQPLRQRLKALTQPVLDQVITPFVEQNYPDTCGKGQGRKCTPCYSLVRRYRRNERQSHATHRDGHAVGHVVGSAFPLFKFKLLTSLEHKVLVIPNQWRE